MVCEWAKCEWIVHDKTSGIREIMSCHVICHALTNWEIFSGKKKERKEPFWDLAYICQTRKDYHKGDF